ncbi:MAG: cold-shock protein [Bacteroidota bacterium]
MGRSNETYRKKEVRSKKEKKKKDKEQKKQARKNNEKQSMDDMIAYVDENGVITNTPPDPSEKEEIQAEEIEVGVPKSEDKEKEDPIRKGVVTFFNDSKGYGFIKDSETKESVFVHVNNLIDDVIEGNLVNYEVEMGQRGPAAVRVKHFKEDKEDKEE